jgi:hypothetical protein
VAPKPKRGLKVIAGIFLTKSLDADAESAPPILVIDTNFITNLNKLRIQLDTKLLVSSSYRCTAHNAAVGGATASFHMKGMAADIATPTADFKSKLLFVAKDLFGGIIAYNTWMHATNFILELSNDQSNKKAIRYV